MKKYKKIIAHNLKLEKPKLIVKYNAYETFVKGILLIN